MPPEISCRFLVICRKLSVMRGLEFEELCHDYLKARYPNLTPWRHIRLLTPRIGPIDAFLLDNEGNLIACQYGSSASWEAKLVRDAQKVKKLADDSGLQIGRFIFCTTAEIEEHILIAWHQKIKDNYGFRNVEICSLEQLASALEKDYPGIAYRRLGIPIPLQHFMTLDAYLDSYSQRYWPRRTDLEKGMLYKPEEYIKEIENQLLTNGLCLLTGKSASGKSALAIAFSLTWRSNKEGERRHPEAVCFYLEASPGYTNQTGESLYQKVCEHDYQNELFLIDNCHLAPAAVNAFCYQWERRRPRKNMVLLISAPRVSESPWEEEPEVYFEIFEQRKAVVHVQSERIYTGMLKRYSDIYCRNEPSRFTPVDEDLKNPDSARKLEHLCAHNLAATHGILEEWGKAGGRLSDVTEEATLDSLHHRHLTQIKTPTLAPLCCLAQFEIPAHDSFINQLSVENSESIQTLRAENLLQPVDSPYGRCYQIDFHPQTAAQIFRAYVKRKVGTGYKSRIDDEIFTILKNYLSTCPENFNECYYRLYLVEALEVQERLLRDVELQDCAQKQFATRPLNEVTGYLYGRYRIEPSTAVSMLRYFVNQTSEETLKGHVLALSGTQFYLVSSLLPKISQDIAKKILGNLPAEWVVKRIKFAPINFIGRWILPTPTSLTTQLGYSEEWCKEVAKEFDIDWLVANIRETTSMQSFTWFLRDFVAIEPGRAKLLTDKLTPEILGQKLNGQPISVIHNFLSNLKILRYDLAFYKRFVKELNTKELCDGMQKESLLNSYWILRDLKNVVPKKVEEILKQMSSRGLAEIFREKKATAANLNNFLWVCNRDFAKDFISEFTDTEMEELFARSRLDEVGSLMEFRYHSFKKPYAIFKTKYLQKSLDESKISEIGKFIVRLQRIPQEGKKLAQETLELLLKTDLGERIAASDLDHFSTLLRNANSVDSAYSKGLLQKTAKTTVIEKSLAHSGIRGIQFFLHQLRFNDISDTEPTFWDRVRLTLKQQDLKERFAKATFNEISNFLWNVRKTLGPELAQDYCKLVDAHLPDWITCGDIVDLGNLLWNLVHISDLEDFEIFRAEGLKVRLQQELKSSPGPCIRILGIALAINANAVDELNFRGVNFGQIHDALIAWLKNLCSESHPYNLAQTVIGMRALSNEWAKKIVKEAIPQVDQCLTLLQEAMSNSETPHSKPILEEAANFVRQTQSE